jgi:PIN domain
MKSATDTASEITARTRPVIFVDTCSILDLTARGLRDNKFRVGHARAAMDIARLAGEAKVTIVLPEQVLIEFEKNFDEVQQEAIGLVTKLNGQLSQLNGIVQAYGHNVSEFSGVTGDNFASATSEVVDVLMAAALHSKTTDASKLRAGDRVIAGKAPAGGSKQSFKDCLILESCLETLAAARVIGFAASAHFLSSNTTEYASAKNELHQDLVGEFSASKLEFARTFAELRYHHSIRDL